MLRLTQDETNVLRMQLGARLPATAEETPAPQAPNAAVNEDLMLGTGLAQEHLQIVLWRFTLRGITACLLGETAAAEAALHAAPRPLAELDLMVDAEAAREAYRCLLPLGWRSSHALAERTLEAGMPLQLVHRDGSVLHLHTHVIANRPSSFLDRRIWNRARLVQTARASYKTLAAPDLLLSLSVCAVRQGNALRPYAVADAYVLAGALEAADWERFAETTLDYQLVWPALKVMRCLAATLGAAAPEGVMRRLETAMVSPLQQYEYESDASFVRQLMEPLMIRQRFGWQQRNAGARGAFLDYYKLNRHVASSSAAPTAPAYGPQKAFAGGMLGAAG